MSSAACACNVLADVSNAGGIVGLALQGAVGLAVGYQAIGSPHTALKETWERLGNIRTHLKAVTPERKRRIDAAAAMRLCRTLTSIENQFQDLWDAHSELSQKYEQSSYIQRHFGQLRQLITNLEDEVRGLLTDTWATTRAHVHIPRDPPPPSGHQSNSTDITPTGRVTTPSDPDVNHESVEMTPV